MFREARTWGDHLRRKRVSLGLRQRDAAADLGISVATLQRWETNQTVPLVRLLPLIAQFLGYVPYVAPKSFGEWLLMVRQSRGLSRKRLALELGLDESTLARWERGLMRPTRRLQERAFAYLVGGT
jgi:transcriptional regulator with XRE-family HTH domain